MVSLAETHLKLLFSADTEERELQGFTLVQLLLVSTAVEPCFMDTSLLQTVFLVPGENKPSHFLLIQPTWYAHPVIYRHFPWVPCKHGFMSRVITRFAWKYYGSTVLCEQCQSVQSNFSPGWKFDWYPVNVTLLYSKIHWPDINHCWKSFYSSLIC